MGQETLLGEAPPPQQRGPLEGLRPAHRLPVHRRRRGKHQIHAQEPRLRQAGQVEEHPPEALGGLQEARPGVLLRRV